MNTPPMATKAQRSKRNCQNALDLAQQNETEARRQRAAGHQPTAAVAIDQRPDQRRHRRADEDFSRAQQRKQTARYGQVLGQRFKKDAERARHVKRASDMREKADGDDVPAVEKLTVGPRR